MFLFFHDIGLPWWGFFIILLIVIALFVFLVRSLWILLAGESKRAKMYAGGIIFSSTVIWLLCQFTGSFLLEIVLMIFTLPFGLIIGFLHQNFAFYVIRDMILGDLNSAHHPVVPHIYLYQSYLNALAIAYLFEKIERTRAKKKMSLQ